MQDTEPAPVTRTREEWAASTEDARRLARYKAAIERARRIREGKPRLTDEQLAFVAKVIHPGGSDAT
jgi:hypothetical protein